MGKITTLFEVDGIRVATTGHDYDFIATIENMTSEDKLFSFANGAEEFIVNAHSWCGLLGDKEGRTALEAIKKGCFEMN